MKFKNSILIMIILLILGLSIYNYSNPIKKFDVDLKVSFKGLGIVRSSVKCRKSIDKVQLSTELQRKVRNHWEKVSDWEVTSNNNKALIDASSILNTGNTYRVVSSVTINIKGESIMFKKISSEQKSN